MRRHRANLTALDVDINDRMTVAEYGLLTSCSRLLYELRVLRSRRLSAASMNDVFRSTVLAKLLTLRQRRRAYAPRWTVRDWMRLCVDVIDLVTARNVVLHDLVLQI